MTSITDDLGESMKKPPESYDSGGQLIILSTFYLESLL